MRSRRYLVTGGLGQVGSYISEGLVRAGSEVVILDNLSSCGSKDIAGARLVKGDIRDPVLVKNLVKDCDGIVHCAAQIFVARSVEDPIQDADNNIMGTLNLLNAARNADIERFVYFSSAAVYGDPERLPVDERHPQNPMSPYGVSKLSGEKYSLAFSKIYDLPATAIRPFNIYSPRQDPSNPYSGVISKFIDNVSKGLPPLIFGDGTATRDFVSVHDVVDMVMLMIVKNAAAGKVFNCGTGQSTTVSELANTVIDLYDNHRLKPELRPERPGDIKYSYADISLARDILGYRPKVELKNGLREIIEGRSKTKS